MNCRREFRNVAAILLLFMMFGLEQSKATKVTLVDNGYQNVLVAISAAAYKSGIEEALQKMLTAASAALMNATGNRTYFDTITILKPGVQTNLRRKSPYRTRRDTWEAYPSFESADIRVDLANAAYGILPYTQQSRGCGEPGDFIHLTPDFINSFPQTYGPPEKLLANEWIKYRYGVFDENGYYDSDRYPQMYYDESETLTENVCSNTVVTWDSNDNNDVTDLCTVKTNSVGVPADCTLTPNKYSNSNLNTSMMSQPLITLATQYCNKSNHNSMAPNKQNILCQGRSIMEIVLSHSDFSNGANPPNSNSNKKPTYTISDAGSANLALVVLWDPMNKEQTYNSIRPSLMKFIAKDFPNNSYFGMIQTTDQPNVPLYSLQPIYESTDRSTIISKIKLMTFSTTATRPFSDVLNEAITMLSYNYVSTQNKAVVFLSNSVSSSDLITSCNTANTSSIQFHYITYNSSNAQNFLNIQSCPGKAFLIQGQTISNPDTEVRTCYKDLQNRALLDNTFMNFPFIIAPDSFTAPLIFHENIYSNSTNGTFIIDVPIETVGAYFYVEGCDLYGAKAEDLIPTRWLGKVNHQVVYDENTVAFFEPSILDKNGTWYFGVSIDPSMNFTIPYVVYAVARSQPVSGDIIQSIQATAWTVADNGITSDGTTYPTVRIFASVKRGTTPVFNAKVEAKIYSGDYNSPTTVTLYDDGSGNPDIATEDGIYSAYYVWSTGTTRSCSIVINATDNNNAATYPTSQYIWINQNAMNTKKTGSFQRTAQPEAFIIASTSSTSPPGKIGDFRVKSISDAKVTFQWTAPGRSLDSGTATKYILGCSNDWYALNVSKLEGASNVDTSYSMPTPAAAKTVQTKTIDGSADQKTHYCAIQAVGGQIYGEVSPIQSYYITYSGLSTGAIAGIVVGVLLGLLLLILIVVLIWWCCSKDEKQATTSAKTDGKLQPIIPITVLGSATSERGSKPDLTEERYQNRPQSAQSKTHSQVSGSHFTDEESSDDGGSRYRSPSPRVPMPPQIPMVTFHQEQRMPGGEGNEYDSTLLVQHADVAVPEVIKLAEIEAVSEYSQAKLQDPKPTSLGVNDMQDLPVYKHLLSKQPAPQPPPRGPSSVSSSTYSLNSVGRQTPALHNTQV